MRRVALIAALLALAHAGAARAAVGEGRVTWYPDVGVTADGTAPIAGVTAACGWAIPMHATVTLPDGASYLCTDRIGEPISGYDVDVAGEPSIPARMAPYCHGWALNLCPVEVSP